MPAEFLCNLPKNLTTHLTHKLYAVFPCLYDSTSAADYTPDFPQHTRNSAEKVCVSLETPRPLQQFHNLVKNRP
ncbi:MAG TPA: hypothetical protein DHU76_00475 [Ruminococcus sp.]|nr:hypothetical protein [Ruminococcus sp.]HCY33633.1 hypothetical protein [Ruminococcus sp.]